MNKSRVVHLTKKMHIYGLVRLFYISLLKIRDECRNKIIRIMPICANKIVFINFNGKGYGCNPKYIAQEIIRQKLPVDMVWLVSDMDEPMPSEIRKVKWGSYEAKKELSTARIWVKNVKNFTEVKKRKGQFYIQTWHGNMPLKYVEQDAEKDLPISYVKESKQEGKMIDIMLAGCKRKEELIATKFWYSGRIMTVGNPRNDIFFKNLKETRLKVIDYFQIEKELKIVLFAPTFRNTEDETVYELDRKQILAALKKRFGYRYIMIKRLHPNVIKRQYEEQCREEIDATDYPDMQELLVAADILITDYSGCMYDFSLMKKPVFLIGKDLEQYTKRERGMYTDVRSLPFPFAKNERQLVENIIGFDNDKYLKELQQLWDQLGSFDCGNASEQVVDEIKKVLNR